MKYNLEFEGKQVPRDNIRVKCFVGKEKEGVYSSFCPALHVPSQGDNEEAAKQSLKEAAQLFVECCYKEGTLKKELRDLHWDFDVWGKTSAPKDESVDNELLDEWKDYNTFYIKVQIPQAKYL